MLLPGRLRIAKRQHAGIDEQPAIAIFGKPGEAIDIGHVDAGSLQRLDERIGQPLRELVQRYQAAGGIGGRHRRMPPAIAERDAAQRQPRWPDRPELLQQFRQDRRRRAACRPSASIASRSIQAAGPRRVAAAKNVRLRGDQVYPGDATDRRGRPIRPAGCRPRPACRARGRRRQDSRARRHRRATARGGVAENAPPVNMARLASPNPSERPIADPVSGSR